MTQIRFFELHGRAAAPSFVSILRTDPFPITVCPGHVVQACATVSNILGTIITHTTNTDCSVTTTTNAAGAADQGASWWEASGLVTASGDGLCATFTVPLTNSGSGTITIHIDYCNSGVCTNCGTSSVSVGYKVVPCKIEVTPASASALINGCYPNPNPVFCLSDSCPGSGINWAISPGGLAGGASLTINGDCVTVNMGDVETNYTITATSADNTNCSGSASLTVKRDCSCSNHRIDLQNMQTMPPGQSCGLSDHWTNSPIVDSCGHSLQLICNGRLEYSYDGQLIGYCSYSPSQTEADYWFCQCGAMLMRATLIVIKPTVSPKIGKMHEWNCTLGVVPTTCFTVGPDGWEHRECDGGD